MESGATRVHTTSAATVEAEMATYMASASVLLVELRGGVPRASPAAIPSINALGRKPIRNAMPNEAAGEQEPSASRRLFGVDARVREPRRVMIAAMTRGVPTMISTAAVSRSAHGETAA
jgi:hypothetical protein